MKQATLLLALLSVPLCATNYQGVRVGMGSAMGMKAQGFDTMYPQWRLELGYDVNRVISINTYYQNLERWETEERPMQGDKWRAGAEIKGGRIGAEIEAGWTIDIEDGWGVKPYVAAGLVQQFGDVRSGYEHNGHGPMHSTTLNRAGETVALGARIMPLDKFGAYIDGRIDSLLIDNDVILDTPHATLTIGFRF